MAVLGDVLNGPTVVIGDLVASRRVVDRRLLHSELVAALDTANDLCDPAEPLRPTVGDECQGVFHSVADALRATLLVRVSMDPSHDIRFGVGVGEVVMLGDEGRLFRQQDGPGWWAARDAIDHVAGGRDVPATLRTWLAVSPREHSYGRQTFAVTTPQEGAPGVRAVNAFLATRDHLVSTMDARDRRILRGLLLRRSMTAIAEAEGVTKSAISQRTQRSGASVIAFADATSAGGPR